MKKFLIGCTAVFLILILILTAGGIYLAMQVKKFGGQVEQNVAAVTQLNKDYPFTAPKPAATQASFDPERLAIYFETRTDIWNNISSDAGVIEATQALSRTNGNMKAKEALSMVSTGNRMFKLVGEILRKHEMSAAEYQWTTRQIYGTLVGAEKQGLTASKDAVEKIRTYVNTAGSPQGRPNDSLFDVMLNDGLRTFEPGDLAADEQLLLPYLDQFTNEKLHFLEIILTGMEVNQRGNNRSIRIGNETIDLGPMGQTPPPAEAETTTE